MHLYAKKFDLDCKKPNVYTKKPNSIYLKGNKLKTLDGQIMDQQFVESPYSYTDFGMYYDATMEADYSFSKLDRHISHGN